MEKDITCQKVVLVGNLRNTKRLDEMGAREERWIGPAESRSENVYRREWRLREKERKDSIFWVAWNRTVSPIIRTHRRRLVKGWALSHPDGEMIGVRGLEGAWVELLPAQFQVCPSGKRTLVCTRWEWRNWRRGAR